VSPSVSIIVACRDEVGYIQNFLDVVGSQVNCDFEVLIADGMSRDGTRAILDEWVKTNPRHRVVENPGRIVSTGLNAAIRAARGEIIIRMDVHTQYAPDYVASCVHYLKKTGADNVGGPARTKAIGVVQRAIAAAYNSTFSCGGARFHDENYEGYVDTVVYGCWYKNTLERVGLFDETLVRNQDDELNLRLHRMGGKLWQTPSVVSWYVPRSSLYALFRQYFQYGFWKFPVIRKHRIPASWRHVVPALFVLGNLFGVAVLMIGMAFGFSGATSLIVGIWAGVMSLYILSSLAASVSTAKKRGWDLLPLLPAVYGVYHFSYGTGSLAGLIYWSMYDLKAQPDAPFANITR